MGNSCSSGTSAAVAVNDPTGARIDSQSPQQQQTAELVNTNNKEAVTETKPTQESRYNKFKLWLL